MLLPIVLLGAPAHAEPPILALAQGEVIAGRAIDDHAGISEGGGAPGIWLVGAAIALGAVFMFRLYRVQPGREREPTRLAAPAMAALFGCMLLVGPVAVQGAMNLGLVAGSVPDGSPPDDVLWNAVWLLGVVSAGHLVVAILWAALVIVAPGGPVRRKPWPVRAFRGLIAGAIGLLVVGPIVVAATEWTAWLRQRLAGETTPLLAHESLRMVAEAADPVAIGMFAALVVLIVPLTEEVMYRGLAQGALRALGVGPWPAVLIASVVFTAMHVGAVAPAGLAGLFVLSIGLGVVYERTGTLAAPAVLHALFNASNLWLLWMSV